MDQDLLLPQVTVYVHEMDCTAHPAMTPGTWRWAVHVGGRPPHDLAHCVQAGGELDRGSAITAGDQVAAAVCVAMRIFGIPASPPTVVELTTDPIPPGRDYIRKI
jgi:hypothetical protein